MQNSIFSCWKRTDNQSVYKRRSFALQYTVFHGVKDGLSWCKRRYIGNREKRRALLPGKQAAGGITTYGT